MKHSLFVITLFLLMLGMQGCFFYSFFAALTGHPDNLPGFIGLGILLIIIGSAGYKK